MQQIIKDLSIRYATEKIDDIYEEDIARTIVMMMGLEYATRKYGLTALDDIIKKTEYKNKICNYIKENMNLMINAVRVDTMEEIIANKYFSSSMYLKDRLLYYICGRGCIAIQQGLNLMIIKELLLSIVPDYLRDGVSFYIIQYENELIELVDEKLHEIEMDKRDNINESKEEEGSLEELFDSML